MARIVYSGLVDSINGSISGTTFQRNAYGFTVKGKPRMVKPNSARQIYSKSRFSGAVANWRSLDLVSRGNWETYATNWPVPSRLNPSSYLNGYNAFLRYHGLRAWSDSSVLANPADGNRVFGNPFIELQVDAGLFFSLTGAPVTGTWRVFVFMSRPITEGNRGRQNLTKHIQNYQWFNNNSIDIQERYENVYGFPLEAEQTVVVDCSILSLQSGQVIVLPTQTITVLPP